MSAQLDKIRAQVEAVKNAPLVLLRPAIIVLVNLIIEWMEGIEHGRKCD